MTLRRLNFYNLALPEDTSANAILKYSTTAGSFQWEFLGLGYQGTTSGYSSGATPDQNIIDKFPFSANANASDVGDLTVARGSAAGQSSLISGYTSSTTIDKFPFASGGNASGVGSLSQGRYGPSGQSSSTNGYSSGGGGPPRVNIIDKFPFAVDANATDVGDLSQSRAFTAGQSSRTSGYATGGYNPPSSPPAFNTIDKFPFASDSNATFIGALTVRRNRIAGQNSLESGYTAGGLFPMVATIDKFPFATDTGASGVGSLTQARYGPAGQSSDISGYSSGGWAPPAPLPTALTIDKFPFAANANATDVGDLTVGRTSLAGQQF